MKSLKRFLTKTATLVDEKNVGLETDYCYKMKRSRIRPTG